MSYWLEIKDLTFYYKCKSGGYEVDAPNLAQRLDYRTSSNSYVIFKSKLYTFSFKKADSNLDAERPMT